MDIYEAIRQRHSVRAYKSTPVEKEKLDRILNAAVIAPTAKNLQAFKIFVYNIKGKEEDFWKIYPGKWLTEAPLVLLVCTVKDKCWIRRDGKDYGDVDSAIIMDHIILSATAEGLGTCWVGAFNAAAAREILGLPDNLEPLLFTPLGYGQEAPFQKIRKDVSELVEFK